MISKESMVQLQEAENIIAKLKSLEGFYEPELFRVVIKDLIPEYQSVAGNTKVVNFTTGKKINQYKYQN